MIIPGLPNGLFSRTRVPPVFVGGKQEQNTSNPEVITLTGLSGGISTSPAAGDVVVIGAVGFDSGTTITASTAGYTKIATAGGSGSFRVEIFAKKLTSAETQFTCTTSSSTNFILGVVHVWRGVNNVILDTTPTTTQSTSTTAGPDSPSINVVTPSQVVLAFGVASDDITGPPSGMSNYFAGNYAGFGNKLAVASIIRTISGAYNPSAWPITEASPSGGTAAVTIALRPL